MFRVFLFTFSRKVITSPTRITDRTETCIYHVLTISSLQVSQMGVINVGLSDHGFISSTRKSYQTQNFLIIRRYSFFKETLKKIHFLNYLKNTCVNAAYSDFVRKFVWVNDSVAPIKKVRVKTNSKPCFETGII